MKYYFRNGSYSSVLKCKGCEINAILDSGATNTTLDIYSLCSLTGMSMQSLYTSIMKRINNKKVLTFETASGVVQRGILIRICNVSIDEQKFPEFYCLLNIDSDIWKTGGIVRSSGKEFLFTPHILIGTDIIRSCKIYDNSDNIFTKGDALILENYNQKKHKQIISQLNKPIFGLGSANSAILELDDNEDFADTQSGSESNIF